MPLQHPPPPPVQNTTRPVKTEATSQHRSPLDHREEYEHLNDSQLKALCKGKGYAQSGNRDTLIQRLREHDTRVANAEDRRSRGFPRSATGDGPTGATFGLIALGEAALFACGAVVCVGIAVQSLWLLLKDHLSYWTVITILEWRRTLFWWAPLALGVTLAVGKFWCFPSRSGGLKFSPLYTILSSRTMQVVCWGPRDPHIRPGDHPNHPEPTSRASRGEQSPPTTNLSAPDLGETLPERTPPPPSPTTPTRNGNGIEIPSLDARWIDTELSRGLDTLKDDAGWNIPRGRRDTNTALLLPSLPPTPDIFTHIPKRFLIRRALSETSLNAQTVQDRDLYSGLYQSLSQEVSALKGKDTEIQGLRREKEVLANMMRRACRESFLARGNVWTVARIRDPIGTDEGEPRLQYSLDATRTQLRIPLHQDPTRPVEEMATVKPFTFDCVLTPPVSNRVVFEKFETLTQAVLDGFNLCIIADGQSGSGKSYTMMNGPTAIAASAMTSIFAELHNSMSFDYKVSVTCSVLEIYKEHPRDLLGNEKVRISRNLAEPIGCSHHPLHNSDELVALIRKACAQRTDRPTRQNQSSSRGDLVIIITISQHNVAPLEPIVSKLVLVDLAGSESSSSCSSENADEVKIIKKGRECLQRMMIAYEGSKATVPESQLTQLLRRCFEAPSKIILLATASPLQKDQKATQATLDFADRIRNGAAKPSGKRKPQPT